MVTRLCVVQPRWVSYLIGTVVFGLVCVDSGLWAWAKQARHDKGTP